MSADDPAASATYYGAAARRSKKPRQVTVFTEELPWLKGRDLELVMGEALCNWVGWPLPA
jgi:hypothetical protein